MNILIMIGQLVLGLSILVFFHELGHYIAARIFGIRVDKFYLFFDAGDFRLFRFRIGETEYGMGWLPLGGYCKIAGMVDESMDKDQMKQEPKSWEYRSKPAWQRFFVVTGGVFMNLILGILIFTGILFYQDNYLPTEEVNRNGGIYAYPMARELGFQSGDQIIGPKGKPTERFADAFPNSLMLGGDLYVMRNGEKMCIKIPSDTYRKLIDDTSGLPLFDLGNYPTQVKEVSPGSPAQEAGILNGDIIVAVNGQPTPSFGSYREAVNGKKLQEITFTIIRTDSVKQTDETIELCARTDSSGKLGIWVVSPYRYKKYTLGGAFRYGTIDALDMLWTNIRGLGKVVNGEEKAKDSIQGPIGIATVYGSVWNWARFWFITGILSLALAFMNILPIPGLDGGHMMFTLYEIITRRKVSDKVLETAQTIGMALLLALMIFVIANDILKVL